MKTFSLVTVVAGLVICTASAYAGPKPSKIKDNQNQGKSEEARFEKRVPFSGTFNEIKKKIKESSPLKVVRLGSGIEISDGVILTLSHVLKKVEDLPSGAAFVFESTSKHNEHCIQTSEHYPIAGEGEISSPRAVSILSDGVKFFILRKTNLNRDGYSAVPVFKDLLMDSGEDLSEDPVRILLESENSVLSKHAKDFILDWDALDLSGVPSFFIARSGFLLKFASMDSKTQETLRFLWDVRAPSVFSNWKPMKSTITGPSLKIAVGMSGGGLFIEHKNTYKLMGLLIGQGVDKFPLDYFKKFPELKAIMFENGAQKEGEFIVKKDSVRLKEVNFEQISKAIRKSNKK